MNKILLFVFLIFYGAIFADAPVPSQIYVVGGGIVGALESYYAYKDAEKRGGEISVTVYEKMKAIDSSTACNIVPSLTIDEILSIVPRGAELTKKLTIPFYQPGGIRVDDVEGVNDSDSARNFKEAVSIYGLNKDHDDRTLALLMLGKRSMELWQEMYDEGDDELRAIMVASNFNPCREPRESFRKLGDGYRVDLIYNIPNAKRHALSMKADYERLGYKNCALLSPDEVIAIDRYLADFCYAHSYVKEDGKRVWQDDSVALWRPGGCIDVREFLPRFYAYLKKTRGSFRLEFNKEVCGVEFESNSTGLRIARLKFTDGTSEVEVAKDAHYVFCPGESVGTLSRLGFHEPAYAGFAGASLLMTIPIPSDKLYQIDKCCDFSHCMEVHNEGIVLAWQARFKGDHIFIGVAGTKAFYGDKQPSKDEEFAKERNLVQLNMINNVLGEFITLACGYETAGKTITSEELACLEEKGIARRWVGRRAVAYDGFPTIGFLYSDGHKVNNARCTTHLGSGGVSFGPAAVSISQRAGQDTNDLSLQKVLKYADSRRSAGMLD